MLFIVGASRSGTTMLNRILGNHSHILGLRELHYFGDLWKIEQRGQILPSSTVMELAALLHARQLRGVFQSSRMSESDQGFGTEIAESLAAPDGMDVFKASAQRLAALAGKRLACEQTPRNIYYAKQLLNLDPNVRVIQLIRDPRAVAASQKNRWKRKQLGAKKVPWAEVVRTWSNYHPLTMARLWLRAEHLGAALQGHPRFVAIRFEDLTSEPESMVRKLCGFIGVDFESGMLDVPLVGSSQRQDLGQRGISAHGIDAWRKVLSPCEAKLLEVMCSQEMERHGYQFSDSACSFFGALVLAVRYPLHLLAVALSNPRRALIQAKAVLAR